MKSSVEALEGNQVKLYVEVEEAEFDAQIDKAFKLIAKEVRLPGFRPGKAPRKVLEAQVGIGPAREQALRDGVPEYLARAVRENDVDLIATPEVEITDGKDSGPVEFEAMCTIRPIVEVPGYDSLTIELPVLDVTEADLDAARQVELRKNGSLVDADRPAESATSSRSISRRPAMAKRSSDSTPKTGTTNSARVGSPMTSMSSSLAPQLATN